MSHNEITAAGHKVPHHFDSAEQAFESSKLGLWIFLVTEILLFGGLFVAYTIFRGLYPATFHEASQHLNKILGSINTVVLICSSLSMALAVDRVRQNDRDKAHQYMLMTLFFAACFMIIKYVEYSHKFHEGLLPGAHFTFAGLIDDPKVPLFFSLYFMMTGLHGIHVIIGMIVMLVVLAKIRSGRVTADRHGMLEYTGLYWHLVDLIWIFLLPLFYLTN